MAIKTNKSYTKRLKVTKTGKILARKPGQNHFNVKEDAKTKFTKKRKVSFTMNNKQKARFLPNTNTSKN